MAVRLGSPWRQAPIYNAHEDDSRIRAFFKTSAGRVLALSIACWLLAFTFCKYQFWRDPNSTFFDSSAEYEMKYTSMRQAEAKMLIDSAGILSNQSHRPSMNPVMCAGVISVKRRRIQYLNETIGSLLVGLTEEERSALNVQVLFADPDPSIHPDYNSEWLKLLDYWSGYNISESQMEVLIEYQAEKRVRAKAVFDYVYMLEQCYNQTTAPYIAIFEDDIIFADSWLVKTLSALAEIWQKDLPWLYLRLFWTDLMLGWDKAIDPWYTNPIFTYIFALSLAYAAAFGIQRRFKHSRPYSDMGAINVFTCITIPAFITLIFMIGQNSLLPFEGLQRMDAKGCCTQALIYPRSQVPALMDMLWESDPAQTDLMIEGYADKTGFARYAIAPQLVQHVGVISSRGGRRGASRKTRSYSFETFSAKKLRKEHDQLAKWGIWRTSNDGCER